MKILIAGGSGLIGSALRSALIAGGHKVVIISRTPEKSLPGVESISWHPEEVAAEIETSDAVINLAGASIGGTGLIPGRWTPRRKSLIRSSRLDAGAVLTKAIQSALKKPAVLVQASAIGFYGNTGAGAVDENSPAGSDFLAEICQVWENSTLDVESRGVRRVIIRIGLVLSPEGGLFPLLSLPYRLFVGGRIGSGQQYMSWIQITDLVRAIQHLVETPEAQGVFNLVSPNPVQNQEFGKVLASVLRRPDWFPIPAWLLKIALGEAATLALDGREVYPIRLLKSGFSFNLPDLHSSIEHTIGKA